MGKRHQIAGEKVIKQRLRGGKACVIILKAFFFEH